MNVYTEEFNVCTNGESTMKELGWLYLYIILSRGVFPHFLTMACLPLEYVISDAPEITWQGAMDVRPVKNCFEF